MPERQITYTNATQLKLFPTTAYLFQLETTDFLDDFSSKLRHMRDVEKIGTLGYMGNWCSPDTLDLKEDWNFIKSLLIERVETCMIDLGIKHEEVIMNCMWANIQKTGGTHQQHSHPNCMFSGVLYLDVPNSEDELPGDFYFRDPNYPAHHIKYDYTSPKLELMEYYTIRPQKGKIIIFPYWLEHGTYASKFSPEKERISVSFNIKLKTNMVELNTIRAEYK
jgi:uncharacterized protein (TIGR02466 family)